jgi:ERCC4-type nuclease
MTTLGIVDDREHGLRELFQDNFTVAHLPVGDIWIGVDENQEPKENGLIIERKSAADLESSIMDGRYREQRSRLMAYCTEKKAHPIYIIEGDLDRFNARLKKPALMKFLTRLSLRYHVSVFQTACVKETAELCALLADQMLTDPTTFEQPAKMTYVETRGTSREANSDDPHVFACSVLACCRGVSAAGARAVLEGCGGTLDGVWKAGEAALAAVVVGKQKFGAVKAKRLWALLHAGAPVAPAGQAQANPT